MSDERHARPECPVSEDHPDRWRWMLDGDQWIRLSKAHARRLEEFRQSGPLPAGEVAITEWELKRALELAELDGHRARLERGGEKAGAGKRQETINRRETIKEIAAKQKIDLESFRKLTRPEKKNVVNLILRGLAEESMLVSDRTIRNDIKAINLHSS